METPLASLPTIGTLLARISEGGTGALGSLAVLVKSYDTQSIIAAAEHAAGLNSQCVTAAGFWSLDHDTLKLLVGFVDPVTLPSLARVERRCLDAVRPQLQALAELYAGLEPFEMRLAPVLHHLPQLEELLLDDNRLYEPGAVALAQAAADGALPHLRRLLLTECSLGNDGMKALAPALRHLPRLEDLSLANNVNKRQGYGDDGIAAIAAAAACGWLTKLKHLDLRLNRSRKCFEIFTEVFTAQAQALPFLETLWLRDNGGGGESEEELAKAICDHYSFPSGGGISDCDNFTDWRLYWALRLRRATFVAVGGKMDYGSLDDRKYTQDTFEEVLAWLVDGDWDCCPTERPELLRIRENPNNHA